MTHYCAIDGFSGNFPETPSKFFLEEQGVLSDESLDIDGRLQNIRSAEEYTMFRARFTMSGARCYERSDVLFQPVWRRPDRAGTSEPLESEPCGWRESVFSLTAAHKLA